MIRINLIRGKRRKRAQFSGEVIYLVIPLLRITSYNVCYTKLLRIGQWGLRQGAK